MHVFVIICCDDEDNNILFVDRVYQNKAEAIEFCCSQNADILSQTKGYFFDYREVVML